MLCFRSVLICHSFQPTDPNFQLCEQCAWYTIRNHRNLSVNSHETRRRIDGMIEKFVVGNYPQHAQHFRRLCDELIAHPLCVNHYEVDVQWAIIDFLLNVSYNPVGSIRRSRSNVEFVNLRANEENTENDVEYWVNLLKEDCIPIDQQQCDLVDSDLSVSICYFDIKWQFFFVLGKFCPGCYIFHLYYMSGIIAKLLILWCPT